MAWSRPITAEDAEDAEATLRIFPPFLRVLRSVTQRAQGGVSPRFGMRKRERDDNRRAGTGCAVYGD